MTRDRRGMGTRWRLWAALSLLIVLAFVWAWGSLDPPPPQRLTIAAGPADGAYYAIAQAWRAGLGREGFQLELLETAGSQENLQLLRQGRAQLALVQGGTAAQPQRQLNPREADSAGLAEKGDDTLVSLASLFYEPVWFFYRAGITSSPSAQTGKQSRDASLSSPRRPDQDAANEPQGAKLADLADLGQLAGCAQRDCSPRLAIGGPGSGTRPLALRLLQANGLSRDDLTLLDLGGTDATQALLEDDADAVLMVAATSAPYLLPLLEAPELELLSFRRHRAYRRSFPFLSRVVLGQGAVDLAQDLPAEDVSLLATAASLVTRADLHPDLIPLLLGTAHQVHGNESLLAPAGTFPNAHNVELPILPAAQRYLEEGPSFLYRIFPFRTASILDRLKILLLPILTLLLPVLRLAPPLYRWQIRSKIYRWYEDLRNLDEELLDAGLMGFESMKGASQTGNVAGGGSQPDAAQNAPGTGGTGDGRLPQEGVLAEEASHPTSQAHGTDDAKRAELRYELLRRLEHLDREVAAEVSVPLSYMDEYYRLRQHIDLLRQLLHSASGIPTAPGTHSRSETLDPAGAPRPQAQQPGHD